ncbi:MAG: hypothetical protein AAF634_13555, partial [Bacteroidota bacterium]
MKHNCLFFICPTDCLELVINRKFGNNNCYYTSVCNSVVFNQNTTRQIKSLILENNITEISFVLSNANPIMRDALENKHFYGIRGLDHIYDTIAKQKKYSEMFWQKNNCLFTILSYYLNERIKNLRSQLDRFQLGQIQINGKIYDQNENVFEDI